jgi:hypothetical protein
MTAFLTGGGDREAVSRVSAGPAPAAQAQSDQPRQRQAKIGFNAMATERILRVGKENGHDRRRI